MGDKRWSVGDRVVFPHRARKGGHHNVWTVGTVTAVDLPGLPPGVKVEYDEPDDGCPGCYARHDELEPALEKES